MITGKILGETYVMNGVSADASGFVPDMSADTYYEVIRLVDGKVLFLPDHLERFRRSLSGSYIPYPGDQQVIETIRLLVTENRFREGNIRICLQHSAGKKPLLLGYFVPYIYPDANMYREGVKMATYPHQRPNPGIKKWDDRFRKSVAAYILENRVYEAALVNSKQQITEGSRSNIFFIDLDGQTERVAARNGPHFSDAVGIFHLADVLGVKEVLLDGVRVIPSHFEDLLFVRK